MKISEIFSVHPAERLGRAGYLVSLVILLSILRVVTMFPDTLWVLPMSMCAPWFIIATIRRLNDMGESPWLTAMLLVPFLNGVVVVIFLLAPGADDASRKAIIKQPHSRTRSNVIRSVVAVLYCCLSCALLIFFIQFWELVILANNSGKHLSEVTLIGPVNHGGRPIWKGTLRPGDDVLVNVRALLLPEDGEGELTLSFRSGEETRRCVADWYVTDGSWNHVEIKPDLSCNVTRANRPDPLLAFRALLGGITLQKRKAKVP